MQVILGPPGSGKTTQCQLLEGFECLSIGQLLRQQPSQAASLARGELSDLDYLGPLLQKTLEGLFEKHSPQKVILDGFPRIFDQARWLVENYPELSACLVLSLPKQVSLARLLERKRSDDHKVAINKRLETYYQNLPEVLEYLDEQGVRVVEINGDQSPKTVLAEIRGALFDTPRD